MKTKLLLLTVLLATGAAGLPVALAQSSEAALNASAGWQETASSHQSWRSVLRDELPCWP